MTSGAAAAELQSKANAIVNVLRGIAACSYHFVIAVWSAKAAESNFMCSFLEIAGIIVGVIGVGWAVWESHKRNSEGGKMFFFLRGVKTNAEGNANNKGDTSAAWKALVTQIDDINKRVGPK